MAKKVLSALLLSLVTFALLEAALRAFDLPRYDTCWAPEQDIWLDDPELGPALRPGADTGSAVVNELGLRGPVLPREKDPQTYRVLFIGDSTVFGLGVPLDNTFAHLATSQLGALAPGRRSEYLIGAIPGSTSFQSRVLLARLLPYRPDLVVFYVGARNDPDRARYFRDSAWPERHARRQAAWHDVRTLRALEFMADAAWKKWLRRLRPRTWQARVPPDEFEANMKAMLEATRRAGVPAVVLLPPYSESLAAHQKIIPYYQDILREAAVSYGAPHPELQRIFALHEESAVYFEDGIHPSAKGHQLIADEIVRVVRESGLAPH
jgi:lysophospholipase L1-like esterase